MEELKKQYEKRFIDSGMNEAQKSGANSVWEWIDENCEPIRDQVEPLISDHFMHTVKEKFDKMMMGVNYTEDLIYIVTPYLRNAYKMGQLCKLDEVTLLKNCCVILQEELDKRTNKAIKQAQNSY